MGLCQDKLEKRIKEPLEDFLGNLANVENTPLLSSSSAAAAAVPSDPRDDDPPPVFPAAATQDAVAYSQHEEKEDYQKSSTPLLGDAQGGGDAWE